MSTDVRMTVDERLRYLRVMKPRYNEADREGKSRLLDEMELVTGLDRKVLIRHFIHVDDLATVHARSSELRPRVQCYDVTCGFEALGSR